MTQDARLPDATTVIAARDITPLTVPQALQRLHTRREGLTHTEASARLRAHGANRLPAAVRKPALLQLLAQFTQLFSLILWVAASLAFVAEVADPGRGMARLGLAIVAVNIASGTFAFVQERRVERTLAALSRLLPPRIAALRDGRVAELPIDELVPGDIVLLGQGDVPPADCRVIEAFALRVNLSTLTGEAAARPRDARASEVADALRSGNLLLAGTAIVAGQARAVVFATGERTELGGIARLSQEPATTVSPLQVELERLSRVIGMLSVAIGAAMFLIGAAIGVPVWQDLIFSIGVIVAMVPEGLLPTLTLSLVLAAQRMARRKVLVRHLPSVETLGCVSVICTDKTGTVDLFTVARLCHDLKTARAPGAAGPLGDPLEIALVQMAH